MKSLPLKLIIALAIIIGSTATALAQPDNSHTRTLTGRCPIGPNESLYNFGSFGSDSLLYINHTGGTLTVVEWDKPEIEFLAEIETQANTKKNAEIISNAVDVKMTTEKGGTVAIKTTIDEKQIEEKLENTGYQGISRNTNLTIKVPRGISIRLEGEDIRATIEAPINSILANAEFFSLKATKINKWATIYCERGEIEVDQIDDVLAIKGQHTKVKVGKATNAVSITTSHQDVTIDEARDASINMIYGNLTIKKINELKVDKLTYGDCLIDTLGRTLIVDSMKYGKIKVHFLKTTEYVAIDAAFTNIDMTIKDSDFQALTFDLSGAATPIEMQLLNGSCGMSADGKPIQGTWAKSNTDNSNVTKITVRNRYGSINFKSIK